ncbi:MAG: Mur ligase family protein, partial [Chloroflexota bacterium]
MADIKTLYKHYRNSAGASEDPRVPQENKIYFALTNRRPNTKLKIYLWTIWRWFEVNAPRARRTMQRVAQYTRWAEQVAGAVDEIYDGNGYVDLAFENGATLAVVDNRRVHRPPKTILVENATETLYELARYHRDQTSFPVIGITGTVGKTTTTNLVHAVLNSEKKAYMQNGRNTPPVNSINLLNAPQGTEAVVLEVATVRPGIIAGACEVIQPTHGLITTIGLAHLDTMGDLETIQ